MAIFTNLEAVELNKHGMFESSNMKATTVGNIYDVIVRDESGDTPKEIAVDNGVAVKVGEYTGEGLQTRYATIAGVKDKIAVTGQPALIKDAFTKNQAQEWNFFNKAGKVARAYEDVAEDVFAVADYQFTTVPSGGIKVGQYVVVDGNGGWVAQTAAPATTANGFIGKVHSIAAASYSTMVRIFTVQNVQL